MSLNISARLTTITVFAVLTLLALAAVLTSGIALTGCSAEKTSTSSFPVTRPEAVTDPDEALKLLEDGNKRFVVEAQGSKDLGNKKREKLLAGQKPFAIILSCSDSRVPPELVFDQGLGDLFIIRVAGNVEDQINLGSIEYAVEHLHVPLLVVMGHSKCGAVKATVEGGEVPPNIAAIAAEISPAVKTAKAETDEEEEIIETAVVENVKNTIKDIEDKSTIVEEMVEEGKLKVVGAKYELESGKVEFIEE